MLNIVKAAFVIVLALAASGCTHVFYQPSSAMYYPPELNDTQYRNIYFQAGDGAFLHAWFIPARTSPVKGTIIQFHGNAQNISAHYLALTWLAHKGYNIFTFDYRGYGESPGTPTPEGVYKDGLSALDKAWELHKASGGGKFVVYGQSLGGAIAMRCFADFRHQKETALIVMDSTFMSYKKVARQTLAGIWFTWPLSPLSYLLVSDKYASNKAVAELKTRLLVIHDLKDPVVNFDNGQEIYDTAPGKKEFWSYTFGEGTHIEVFFGDNMKYRSRFTKLLDSIQTPID